MEFSRSPNNHLAGHHPTLPTGSNFTNRSTTLASTRLIRVFATFSIATTTTTPPHPHSTMDDYSSTQAVNAVPVLADDLMRDRARQYVEFLDDDVGSRFKCCDQELTSQTQSAYNYRDSIRRMLDNEQVRLIVNVDELRDYSRPLADGCVQSRKPYGGVLTTQTAVAANAISTGDRLRAAPARAVSA
jgi:hypothetical protein